VSSEGRTAKGLLLEMCVATAGHLSGPREALLITWTSEYPVFEIRVSSRRNCKGVDGDD